MIPALRSRWRRAGTALPAAALALALSCAGVLAAQPATAADGPAGGLPDASLAQPAKPAAGASELRDRIVDAAKATGETPDDASPAKSPFIIGGGETTIAGAPWMVQLGYYEPTTGDGYFCGGTLVAPNKVLTAAHCVAGLDWVGNGAVLAGTTDLDDYTNGTPAGVFRQWTHPRYDADTTQNDIAVLTLDRPLVGVPTLRLAASDDSALYKTGTTGTVYGWGLTSGADDATLSTKLKKANLPLVADATCKSAMASVLDGDYFAAGSMACAGTPRAAPTRARTAPATVTPAARWSSAARSPASSPGASRAAPRRVPTRSSPRSARTPGRPSRASTTRTCRTTAAPTCSRARRPAVSSSTTARAPRSRSAPTRAPTGRTPAGACRPTWTGTSTRT